MKKGMYFVLGCALMIAFGCSPKVRARSFYTGRSDLASIHVDSPDPRKETTFPEQIIYVEWTAPSSENLKLQVKLRYEDGSEKEKSYDLDRSFGSKTIHAATLKEGKANPLQSYFITLSQNGSVIAKTKHKLWVEKVEVKD